MWTSRAKLLTEEEKKKKTENDQTYSLRDIFGGSTTHITWVGQCDYIFHVD